MSGVRKPKVCRACEGKGWVIQVFRERRPRPAYWFQRGPNSERPRACTHCATIEKGKEE